MMYNEYPRWQQVMAQVYKSPKPPGYLDGGAGSQLLLSPNLLVVAIWGANQRIEEFCLYSMFYFSYSAF